MSDDEDYFDDAEYLYIDDGPVTEAVSGCRFSSMSVPGHPSPCSCPSEP